MRNYDNARDVTSVCIVCMGSGMFVQQTSRFHFFNIIAPCCNGVAMVLHLV